jgi:hypothetical protein
MKVIKTMAAALVLSVFLAGNASACGLFVKCNGGGLFGGISAAVVSISTSIYIGINSLLYSAVSAIDDCYFDCAMPCNGWGCKPAPKPKPKPAKWCW